MTTATTQTVPPKPRYQLACHGCMWRRDDPRDYQVARAIAWAHQHQVAIGRERHAVEFVFVNGANRQGNRG